MLCYWPYLGGGIFFAYKYAGWKKMDCSAPQVRSDIEKNLYKEALEKNTKLLSGKNKLFLWDTKAYFRLFKGLTFSITDTEQGLQNDNGNALSCKAKVGISISDDIWQQYAELTQTVNRLRKQVSTVSIDDIKQKLADDSIQINGNEISTKEPTLQYTVRKFEDGGIGVDINRDSKESKTYQIGFSDHRLELMLIKLMNKDKIIESAKRGDFGALDYPDVGSGGKESSIPPNPESDKEKYQEYLHTKERARIANARFGAAWRMIPQPKRNNLQHAIGYLPKQIENKCRNISYKYPDGYPRRTAYLDCSVRHEIIVTRGIEQFAEAYRFNSNANFFSFVNPETVVASQNW